MLTTSRADHCWDLTAVENGVLAAHFTCTAFDALLDISIVLNT